MILKFPDLDTLKLVLISGAVPPSVSLAPANAGFDEQGQLWLEPSVTPRPRAQDDLKKYGVQSGKKSGAELSAEISCWLEMLPLVREPGPVAPPEQTPVLFDLSSGEQLARLAIEILRLGNDRQSYRWLEQNDGSSRALLRVVGPPYYSLLRALDAQGPDAPVAFAERAARVWVQLGYQHPLEGSIKPPPGQILLLRPPCMWTYLPEQPFREIYEVLEFELPGKPLGYEDGELQDRLKVPLRLARGGGNEVPELWVLRNNPIAELNNLVQNSDDQLLGRLAFAAGGAEGRQTIILRVRPSKLPPPVLVLDAIGFRPFLKLPNLYLPAGQRLHPPLRRDVVRQKLAGDANVLTWLYPEGKDGGFTPESISQDAFRPLTEWVDYIIDRDRAALTAWVQSNTFDFEPFICDEEGPPRPKKAPPPERGSRGDKGGSVQEIEVASPRDKDKGDKEFRAAVLDVISLVPEKPSEQKVRLDELEARFAGFEGPLDGPERQALWPEMALLNMALKNHDDAGICWLNALWNAEDWPESWLWVWFQNECGAVPAREEKGRSKPVSWAAAALHGGGKPRELAGAELDRVLSMKEPSMADVRALAAYLVWASRRPSPPADLAERLNAVGQFLEAHDGRVAVRCSWLAWLGFARLTDGDVLALARTRDRLLERLFQNGLRPDQDLPLFLRHAGRSAMQKFRSIRQWMLDLCGQACNWSREANQASEAEGAGPTLAYIRLYFAFGLARLGEQEASRTLAEEARKLLDRSEEAHKLLFTAFACRIKMAQEQGGKTTGPLPPDLMDALAKMEPLQRYAVNRLRQHSQVLEPDERIDPYADWAARTDALSMKLAETARLTDRQEISQRLLRMLREVPKGNKGAEQRTQILRTALDVSPRISEEFALEILGQLAPAWDALPDAGEAAALVGRAELLQRGLFVAAHFDHKDHVRALVARFRKLLQSQQGSATFMAVAEKLAGESLRGLRKLGMRDEIDQLLKQMADVILGGQDPAALTADRQGPASLRALLHVASGWLFFGRERQAEPIISAARAVLFGNNWQMSQVRERTQLAGVYARTVGGASVEIVKSRLTELFKELHNIRDMMTTAKYYSLMQLDLVEQVVLAIAGEDQMIGADARRWVDDDEYIVRRRIHRDFHAARS